MGKKLGGVNWKTVALDGIPLDGAALEGFVGLEECTDYNLDSDTKKRKTKWDKKKDAFEIQTNRIAKERKRKAEKKPQVVLNKKIKLDNGFIVEECETSIPSTTNENKPTNVTKNHTTNNTKTKEKGKKTKGKNKISDTKTIIENGKSEPKLALEDMRAWEPFQIPEEILRALAEEGFEKPTKIQELCLPAAIMGRRDILGAAETGSGKTLAFGIPILAGIMKLKEQEQSGEDVYNLKFKKSSVKQKPVSKGPVKKEVKVKQKTASKINKTSNEENKESSVIDSSSDNNLDCQDETDDENSENYDDNETSDDKNDDANEESDGDNYLHLSDMIDSDDLGDSSDEEKDEIIDPNLSEEEDESEDEQIDEESVGDGIGCVKVIDNIDLPAPSVIKTGKPLYALIITPTRELAMQISKHLTVAARYTGIRIATVVGGMAEVKQERVLSRGPEVVVCTPGRLWQLMQQGNPHLARCDTIKFLAIDETDRMVERNHFAELRPLLERLNADEGRRGGRQSFVMSATLTVTHDLPAHLRGKKVTKRGKIINRKVEKLTPQQKIKKLINLIGMTDPKIVDLTTDNHGKAGTLTECRITCALEEKDVYLFYVLRAHPGRTIVFCNSIGCVKRLGQLFSLLKCRPLPLHAGMPQRQRLKNLERFAADPHGCLIATDVAARGLDIVGVDNVIHYQVPRTAENYIHRSGRTARANREGLTILMMEPGEALLYSKLCRTLDRTTSLPELPVPPRLLPALRDCVGLARRTEALGLASRRRNKEAGWLERAERECDIVVDEDFVPMKKTLRNADNSQKELQIMKKQLEAKLSKPLIPSGLSYKYPSLNDSVPLFEESSALEAVKKIVETNSAKKQKRTSKNAALLNLAKA